jgi:hypothetical protein
MSRSLVRLVISTLLIVIMGLTGRSIERSFAQLAPQLPYEKTTEGLSLRYPSTWAMEDGVTEHGIWAAWFDSEAQEMPAERIHLNDGAKIELQVFHFLPPDGIQAYLQAEAELAESVASGTTKVGTGEATYEATYIEAIAADDEDARAKTVSFSQGDRWYHITLAIFNYSNTAPADVEGPVSRLL